MPPAPWTVYVCGTKPTEGVETVYVIRLPRSTRTVSKTEVDLLFTPPTGAGGNKDRSYAGGDYDYGDYIPSKPFSTSVEEYVRTNYPVARITDIDYEHGMTEVEILDGPHAARTASTAAGMAVYKNRRYTVMRFPKPSRRPLREQYARHTSSTT